MLKPGDVFLDHLVYRGNPPRYIFALLVKRLTNSDFVHASIYLGRIKDHFIIAQSLALGFSIIKIPQDRVLSRIKTQEKVVLRHKDSTLKTRSHLVEAALFLEGRPYGYFDLVKALVFLLTGHILYKETIKQLTCSESVARSFELANLGFKDQDLDLVFPKDILESEKFKVMPPSEILSEAFSTHTGEGLKV